MQTQEEERDGIISNLRRHRVNSPFGDIAVFDLVGAVVGTEIVFRYFGASPYVGAVAAIPIGAVVHRAMGIKTKI
jgi:hypothetical protein